MKFRLELSFFCEEIKLKIEDKENKSERSLTLPRFSTNKQATFFGPSSGLGMENFFGYILNIKNSKWLIFLRELFFSF